MTKLLKNIFEFFFKFSEELGVIIASLVFGIKGVKDNKNCWYRICAAVIAGKGFSGNEATQYKSLFKLLTTQELREQKAYKYDSIIEESRCVILGDKYLRIYYLAGLPNFLFSASLFRLINLPMPLVLSYHLKGTNKASMIRATRQRISVLESSRNSKLKGEKSEDPGQSKEMSELHQFLQDLINDQEKAFISGVYVAIKANSREQLLEYDRKFQDETQNIELTFNTYAFAQKKALLAVLPLNNDNLGEKHLLPTSGIVNLLPFLSKNLNDPSGIFFGINQYNNSLILLDLFKARNANINIFGTSGSGKSVTAKIVITRLLLKNVQSMIIDPEGEYGKLCEKLGGQNLKLGKGFGIDPFLLFRDMGVSIANRVQILKCFFCFYIQKNNQDSSLLDRLLMQFLENHNEPNLVEFSEELDATIINQNNGLCNDIRQLVKGSLSNLFQGSAIIDYRKELLCFDLSGLNTDEQKIPFLYLIGNFINRVIDKADRQRMIFIDEAHKLLTNQATTDFYIDLVKTARKRKAGVVSITQNPEDFKENDSSRTIITQSETTILLKQAPSSLNYINRFNLFKLTERECNALGGFEIGEAMFIREKEHIFLNIFPFTSEAEYVFS